MSSNKTLGQELKEALVDVIDFEKSGGGLRTTTVARAEPPRHWTKEQIARLRRDKLKISQPVFADLFAVSSQTIRHWEQGVREPSPMARRFMEIADHNPQDVLQVLKPKKPSSRKHAKHHKSAST